jgi:hypothetical protein
VQIFPIGTVGGINVQKTPAWAMRVRIGFAKDIIFHFGQYILLVGLRVALVTSPSLAAPQAQWARLAYG